MSQNKIIVVTGANKGIGLELVRGLALFYKDATVVGTSRHQDLAEKALAELKQSNGITNVKYEILDLKDSHSIEHFAKSIISKYDHIDVLVNNAAIAPVEHTKEATDATLQTNVYGLIDLTEKLLPLVKKSKDPRIVILGSRAGNLEPFSKQIQDQYLAVKTTRDVYELAYAFEGAAHHNDSARLGYKVLLALTNIAYAVSKSLLHAYAAALANEHPEILTTSYCPGPIDTPGSRNIPDMKKYLPKIYPTADGADTGLFLIQSERHHLVNGGFYAERKQNSRVNAPFRND